MIAEALSILLSKDAKFFLIQGFKIGDLLLQFHQLQFVDDTIIFCKANEKFVMNLRSLLRWFQLSSSLRINNLKSVIFGINLDDNDLACMSGLLGCVSSSLPSIYLVFLLC